MSRIVKLTSNFKPVSVNDYGTFRPYFQVFRSTRQWPRFVLSGLEISNTPKGSAIYFWDIMDNCLLILKRKSYGNPSIKLLLPPISFRRSVDDELNILEEFRKAGARTVLSEEDVIVYGYSSSDLEKAQVSCEYIYRVKDAVKLSGRRFKKLRNKVNRFFRKIDDGSINLKSSRKISVSDYAAAQSVYTAWVNTKRGQSSRAGHRAITIARSQHNLDIMFNSAFLQNYMVAWSLTERVCHDWVIGSSGYHDYNIDDIEYADEALHILDCRAWNDIIQSDNALINLGGARSQSVAYHKDLLLPEKKLAIFNLLPYRKLSFEEWRASCSNKTIDTKIGLFG